MLQKKVQNVQPKSEKISRPTLLGVTILTSMDELGFQTYFDSQRQLTDQVVYLAQLSQEAGLDGVCASPLEIEPIRKACGDNFVIVTPGIRPEWASQGDQRRFYNASRCNPAWRGLHCL